MISADNKKKGMTCTEATEAATTKPRKPEATMQTRPRELEKYLAGETERQHEWTQTIMELQKQLRQRPRNKGSCSNTMQASLNKKGQGYLAEQTEWQHEWTQKIDDERSNVTNSPR